MDAQPRFHYRSPANQHDASAIMAMVLVTGGSGFVGTHLLPILHRRFPDRRILAPAFDITDPAATSDAIAAAHPQTVLHLAAVAAPAEAKRDPDAAWRVNLHGALNVAHAVRATPECTMIFVSTADAYGTSFNAGRADERTPLAPRNAYAATKAAADLALGAMAADGLSLIRLRPFNHTGPGQSEVYAVPAFARQIARIEAGLQSPTIEVGDLDAIRDFLDVRDVCQAYAAAIAHAGSLPPGQILNIASGTGRRVGDILNDLLRLSGVTAEIRTDPSRLRPSDIPTATSDPTAARQALDWSPQIPWPQTLQEILEHWRHRTASR